MGMSSNRELFDKTARILKQYYRNIRLLERKNGELGRNKAKQLKIDDDIRNCNHGIANPIKAVSYEITGVLSGKRGCSKIEVSLIRGYERLIEDKNRLKVQKLELMMDISDLEERINPIMAILKDLNNENQELIKLLFKEKMTGHQIGMRICCDRSTISKRKKKILLMISEEFFSDSIYNFEIGKCEHS